MKIKNVIALVLGALVAFSVAACGNDSQPASGENVGLANPFQACETMDDARELAGFDMTLPEAADELEAIEGDMIQALYGENGDEMRIRKALGSQDVSGDYNQYPQTETVDNVTLKGENGQFVLATWTAGAYTYSISVGEGRSQADMMELVAAVQ